MPAKQQSRETQGSSRTAFPITAKHNDVPSVYKNLGSSQVPEVGLLVTRAVAKEDATETEEDEPISPRKSLKSRIGKTRVSTFSDNEDELPKEKLLKSKIGRPKAPTPDTEDDEPPAPSKPGKSNRTETPEAADDEEAPAQSIKSKIGGGSTPSKITSKIGRKKRLTPSDEETEDTREKLAPARIKKEEESQREVKKMTAEEKALEKRDKLKRELEEKRRKEVKKIRKF